MAPPSFAFPCGDCRTPGPDPGRLQRALSPARGPPAAPPAPAVHHSARLPGWPGLGTVAPPSSSSAPGRRSLIGLPPPCPGLLSSPQPNGHRHLVQKFPRGDRGTLQPPAPAGWRGRPRWGAERGGDTDGGAEEAGGGAKVLERKLLKGTGNLPGKRRLRLSGAQAAHVAGCPQRRLSSWPAPLARGQG